MSDQFEYVPDEEPGDDDRALFSDAAADYANSELDEWGAYGRAVIADIWRSVRRHSDGV